MAYEVPPAVESWLRQVVAGQGRDGALTGQQRHFLRVIDGHSRPIQVEHQWLAIYRALVAKSVEQELKSVAPQASTQTAAQSGASTAQQGFVPLSDQGYADRLAARGMFREAQSRVAAIGQAEAPTPEPSTSPVSERSGVRAARDLAALPLPRTEEAQWEYVFWTAWLWDQLLALAKRVSTSGANAPSSVRGPPTLRDLSDGLQTIHDAAGDVGGWFAHKVRQVGQSFAEGAAALEATSAKAAQDLRSSASTHQGDQAADVIVRGGKMMGALAADLTGYGARAAEYLGHGAASNAEVAGSAVRGLVKGASGITRGAVDVGAYTDADIASLKDKVALARQVCALQRQQLSAATVSVGLGSHRAMLEYITVGGLTLAELLAGHVVPGDVQAAYAAAFPAESMKMDFADKAASLESSESLLGLVSAVKGKLFELRYVDELNADLESQGLHASLATSATQPGWDIQITDTNTGAVVDLMSLKATEHVHHVKEALQRYPDIDVVSTSETYAALAGTPEGARVIDGGFDNVDLTEHVDDAATGQADGLVGAGLSLFALLPAAHHHFTGTDKNAAEKTGGFVEEVSRAKSAALVGKGAMLALPYWPVALLASVGVSMMARVGDNRREQYERLDQLLNSVRSESRRLRQLNQSLTRFARE